MKKLLSIDDEPMMLMCLKKALQTQGYDLMTTSDPDEAIKIIKEENISLVLLDVRMPKKDGLEMYKEIRQIKKLPVLFVTAYPKSFTANSDEFANMWQNEFIDGTTDIIYKPFGIDDLFEKVEGLIGDSEDNEA